MTGLWSPVNWPSLSNFRPQFPYLSSREVFIVRIKKDQILKGLRAILQYLLVFWDYHNRYLCLFLVLFLSFPNEEIKIERIQVTHFVLFKPLSRPLLVNLQPLLERMGFMWNRSLT